MADVPRTEPSEVMKKQSSGQKVSLVCAYDDDRCAQLKLDQAQTLEEFATRVPSLSKDEEIVFYCA